MRIAQVAPLAESVPPPGYGGTERVVAYLTEELVQEGHEVTLFASGGSETSAKLRSVYERAPSEQLGNIVVDTHHVAEAYRHSSQFDLIHDHTLVGLVAGSVLPVPAQRPARGSSPEATIDVQGAQLIEG